MLLVWEQLILLKMTLQIKDGKSPARNSPCPCKSGLKYKHCHGDVLKQIVCNRVANEKMVQLIRDEQIKKGIIKPEDDNKSSIIIGGE